MGYLHYAFIEAAEKACELLTGGFVPLVIGVSTFVVSTILAHFFRGDKEAKNWLWDGVIGFLSTCLVGFVLFLILLFVWVPIHTYNKEKEAETLVLRKDIQISKLTDTLEAANERATQLSDALAMGKNAADPDDWPPLSDSQISAWIAALRPDGKKSVSVQWFSSDTDAKTFYKSLKKVGEKVDWTMGGYEPMGDVESGLTVESRPNDPAALTICKLLKEYSGNETRWNPGNYDQGIINIKVGEKITPPSPTPP